MKIAMASGPDHGRLSRASAYAAGRASTSVISTTSTATQNVFQANRENAVVVNRYVTWSEVAGRLNRNGLFWGSYRSRFCLNAVTALHMNGPAHSSAAMIAARYRPIRPAT